MGLSLSLEAGSGLSVHPPGDLEMCMMLVVSNQEIVHLDSVL
jgi:hypothetical protein